MKLLPTTGTAKNSMYILWGIAYWFHNKHPICNQIAIEYESRCENLRKMGTGLNTNQINALISGNLY